jgi:alkanesulfonate monooxygenase SsuD/methylene tetrahydromethanopterin reductase-like flavin-dependent oxidoreductase (luciferase family)
MTKPLALAIHLDGDGAHPAAWRFARHAPRDLLTPQRIIETVGLAETAGFALATFGGGHLPPGTSPNITARLDPLQQAAFAGPLTTRIGLVPEIEATFIEPFHTANQLQSLDHVSRGRGGWLVRASGGPREAEPYGWPPFESQASLSQEASDVIEVNRRLWDSWEDDAVIRDTQTWRYLDRDKLHYADFVGATFKVKGTSYVPRPPQGQLPIFSHDGLVSPQEVDVTIVHAPEVERLPGLAADARARGAALVATDIEVVLQSRGERAVNRLARLDDHGTWASSGNARVVGTPDNLIALLAQLADDFDVIRLIPAVIDLDLPELRFAVLPTLFRDGSAAAPATGTSLRETLGLGVAVNRYAAV